MRPSRRRLAEMARVAEEMTRAGVLRAAERLQPSARGLRLRFTGGKRVIMEGPFAESKELIAGFSIMRLSSRDEVIDLTTRFAAILGGTVEVDVRPLYEPSDVAVS